MIGALCSECKDSTVGQYDGTIAILCNCPNKAQCRQCRHWQQGRYAAVLKTARIRSIVTLASMAVMGLLTLSREIVGDCA